MSFPPKVFDYDEPPFNEVLYQWVKPGSTVLDMGCSSGKLGYQLKQEKGCRVEGVESDARLVKEARTKLDCVHMLDLDKDALPPVRVQYVLLGDILEHLKEPAALLKKCRECLTQDGLILMSIPNIANWQIRLNLLFGLWDYAHPITHWAHLHYFTFKNIKAMVEYCNLRIVRVAPRNAKIKLLGKIRPSLFAFQFIIEAAKTHVEKDL